MVNPLELQNPEFSKGFKGYTCAEVDKYIDYVTEQYAELYREHAELEKKVKLLSEKLDEAKSNLSTVPPEVIDAAKTADEIVSAANEKANAINRAITESFDEIVAKYREIITVEQNNLFEAQKSAVIFKNGLLDGYKEQVRSLCKLIPLDSVDDINLRSADEVVESAITAAGAKLGVDSGSNTSDSSSDEN